LRSEVSGNPYPWNALFAEVPVPVPGLGNFGVQMGNVTIMRVYRLLNIMVRAGYIIHSPI
jgi:hypothetical protein